jgi:hypothetical protein
LLHDQLSITVHMLLVTAPSFQHDRLHISVGLSSLQQVKETICC